MNLMDWDAAKFDVMVPRMNEQHHKLVDLMNKLYDRYNAKASKSEVNSLLVELRKYTTLHFREEEALLEAMQFPGTDRHKLIHQSLLSDFAKHYATFEQGDGSISPKFFFLRLRLTSHIMHIDRKYGEFSKQQQAA